LECRDDEKVSQLAWRARSCAAHYKFLTEVSDVIASRDLKILVDFGMLIPIGERRGRIYKASDELKAVALKIRNEEVTPIHNPFETNEKLIKG
jgi:hypothetical protein